MRPVLRGVLRMEGLYDGTYDLEMVRLANNALNVEEENERRMRAWQEANKGN